MPIGLLSLSIARDDKESGPSFCRKTRMRTDESVLTPRQCIFCAPVRPYVSLDPGFSLLSALLIT